MEKNVEITDEHGDSIGFTYPKRARGLVKNGRAQFVDDCTIRLSASAVPSDRRDRRKSEVKHMNYILFNPRGWILDVPGRTNNQQNNNNGNNGNNGFPFGFPFPFGGNNGNGGNYGHHREVNKPAERCFITDFDGASLTEMIQLGDWNENGLIASEEFSLHPDTDYTFVFWLNGGENDRGNEVCQLQIIFARQYSVPYIYKLNRSFIKPQLHLQGWELYLIPFHTTPSETDVVTELRFIAQNAPLSLKPAKVPSAYKDVVDSPDPYAAYRPQRHNLVFEDGWPSIKSYGGDKYSTEAIKRRLEMEKAAFSKKSEFSYDTPIVPDEEDDENIDITIPPMENSEPMEPMEPEVPESVPDFNEDEEEDKDTANTSSCTIVTE